MAAPLPSLLCRAIADAIHTRYQNFNKDMIDEVQVSKTEEMGVAHIDLCL